MAYKLKLDDEIIWCNSEHLPRAAEDIKQDIVRSDGYYEEYLTNSYYNDIQIKHKTYSSKLFRILWGVELG